MEDEFHGDQLESGAIDVQSDRVDVFEIIDDSQSAPGIFFRSEVQINDGAVLRNIEPTLTAADLLELLRSKLALLQQDIAHFFLDCTRDSVHWIGTSSSFLVFNERMFVSPAVFVNVNACMLASAAKRLAVTLAPMAATR